MKKGTVMSENPPREISLRLVLERPTGGVDFGLQCGQGSSYEVTQKQRSDGHDLQFEFNVTVKSGKDGAPDFRGPFVQGAAGGRFFYINIGTYAGQKNTPWSRRLKVPLSGITWDAINSAAVLVANVPGTGKNGPSCAYEWRRRVSPSWGWQLQKGRKKDEQGKIQTR
jgi:hypothetical protein